MKLAKIPLWAVLVLIVVFAVGVTGWILYDILPLTGRADPTHIEAKDLASLSLESSKYLQSLTTTAFGLATFALGQKWLGNLRITSDRRRRAIVAIGYTFLALSLTIGFVYIETLIGASYNRVLHEKFNSMFYLRLLQAGFFLGGTVCIGIMIVWDVLNGEGEVSI